MRKKEFETFKESMQASVLENDLKTDNEKRCYIIGYIGGVTYIDKNGNRKDSSFTSSQIKDLFKMTFSYESGC